MGKNQEWFKDWFNSPYYHILYKHRDQEEAKGFVEKLGIHLGFKAGEKVLDLACGRGRFSLFLCNKGLHVTGVDIAPENIAFASRFSSDSLHFEVHDMRDVVKENYFKYILNLFTSFGYFETEEEDMQVLQACYRNLEQGGTMVLDFMNVEKIIQGLVPEEQVLVDGIEFCIKRRYEEGFIIKEINFTDKGNSFTYFERVRGIRKEEFERFFKAAGFKLKNIFGNYHLDQFSLNSDRMIFVAEKA